MRPRSLAVVLLCLMTVSAGCTVPFLGGPPETTVENRADDPYRVVAYTTATDDPAGLLFFVTPPNESRQVQAFEDVFWSHGYRNVSLVDEAAAVRQFEVAPGSNTTTTLKGWTSGNATVYLVETLDGELVYAKLIRCEKRGQSHSITIESDGSFGSGSYCG